MNKIPELSKILKTFIGNRVRVIYGPNLYIYMTDERISFQFHQNFRIALENSRLSTSGKNDRMDTFFLSGRINESDSGVDTFDIEAKYEGKIKRTQMQNAVFPSYDHEGRSKPYKIINYVLYGYQGFEMSLIFPIAILFKCEEEKLMMIRIEFPADGLNITFSRALIEEYFQSDPWGKRAIVLDKM